MDDRPLKAILICPDSALLGQFSHASQGLRSFEVALQLDDYPPATAIRDTLRKTGIELVLVDVSSDLTKALDTAGAVLETAPTTAVIALHSRNEPDAILQCLRNGCSEFLSSPFASKDVTQAIERVLRRRPTEIQPAPASRGRLIVFAPVKGGSGATTLAANVAHRIKDAVDGPVLLADFDVTSGVLSFMLRATHQYNVTDALGNADQMDRTLWGSLVVARDGLDYLLAPERPEPALIEPYPVQALLEFARSMYEVVVVDLGGVCESMSMATLSAAQEIYLVCSSDLPSLYMMRRTIPLVEELGYGRDQIHVVVSRVTRRSELSQADMEKIFRASVHATFPDEPSAVQQALREGEPLPGGSDLGRAIGKFVHNIVGESRENEAGTFGVRAFKELLGGA